MKWPETVTVMRHGQSKYNALRAQKEADPDYVEFKKAYNRRAKDPARAQELARLILAKGTHTLGGGDHNTPVTDLGIKQSVATGKKLKEKIALPDVVLVSPYDRTWGTLGGLAIGWPELDTVKTVEEERIREQEHGLKLLYNDWRIFNVLHPEQEQLKEKEGPYWYRNPQGENVPDVRERNRSVLNTITRDFAGQNVLMVTHHLTILAMRANLERMGAAEFIDLDNTNKPVNCGVTIYRGDPNQGTDGKLILDIYNEQLYDDSLAS